MKGEVLHKGKIERVDGNHVTIRIVQTSACLHCKIASHCNSADSKEKIVDVWTPKARQYAIGQEIVVAMSGRMGLKAVLLAFVLPVILAVVFIWVVLQATCADGCYPVQEPYNEGLAALAGMLTFVVYYIGLYFFRARLEEDFRFKIKE